MPNFTESQFMILVTGGTGLVGSHLLYDLLNRGEKVKAIFRKEESLQKTKTVFSTYPKPELYEQINWVKADVTDYFSLKEIFNAVQYVYHTAAMVSFSESDHEQLMEVNVEGTSNLVNLSLEFNIKKFCFVSSVAAFGNEKEGKCVDEKTSWEFDKSITSYSISKYYAENEVWRASEEGLPVVIVNPGTILGFGDLNESSTTIFKTVKEGLKFYPPGSNGFVGVNDVVKSATMLMNSSTKNERYLLVSENWEFKKLLSSIAKGFETEPPKYLANKFIAKSLAFIEFMKSFIFNTRPLLNKESVEIAFSNKCFSAEKIKKDFQFEFEPLEEVVAKTTKSFLAQQSR